MARYEIEYSVPYEGIHKNDFEALEDVILWLRRNASSYEWSLDNITVRGATGEVDVYDLIRRADKGEPLSVPAIEQVEDEVIGLLNDVKRQEVSQQTLNRLDRLRELLVTLMPEAVPQSSSGPQR